MKPLRVVAVLVLAFVVGAVPVFATELSMVYDANGNLVSGDGKFRVYNSLNQLWKIYNGSNASGPLLEDYIYHPSEERILLKNSYYANGSVKETTYYFTKNFVRIVNSSGSYDITLVYLGDRLVLQQNADGSRLYFQSDNKGSVVATSNDSGTLIEKYSYDALGNTFIAGNASILSYEAKQKDPLTINFDFHARQYSPNIGLFEKPDAFLNAIDPQSLNRYTFEYNNPQKHEDPSGHCPWCVAAGVGAVVGLGSYLVYHWATDGQYSWRGAAGATVGGAIAGGTGAFILPLVSGAAAIMGVGAGIGAGSQVITNAISGDPLNKDIWVAAAGGAATAGLSSELPGTKEWLIKNPASWLTTGTGQQYIGNQFYSAAGSAFASYGYSSGQWMSSNYWSGQNLISQPPPASTGGGGCSPALASCANQGTGHSGGGGGGSSGGGGSGHGCGIDMSCGPSNPPTNSGGNRDPRCNVIMSCA